jgi:hypothetical protein
MEQSPLRWAVRFAPRATWSHPGFDGFMASPAVLTGETSRTPRVRTTSTLTARELANLIASGDCRLGTTVGG